MLKKNMLFVFFCILITGCVSGPQFIRGHYYMTGDSDCRYSSRRTDTSINCYNSDKELTGYRDAMTDQQLQMHRHHEREFNRRHENKKNSTHTDCYQFGNRVSCDSY